MNNKDTRLRGRVERGQLSGLLTLPGTPTPRSHTVKEKHPVNADYYS